MSGEHHVLAQCYPDQREAWPSIWGLQYDCSCDEYSEQKGLECFRYYGDLTQAPLQKNTEERDFVKLLLLLLLVMLEMMSMSGYSRTL